MKRQIVYASILSLCLLGGGMAGTLPKLPQITAFAEESTAADCYDYDETTQVLTLRGEVDAPTLINFKKPVSAVVTEPGTVFPEDCSRLFSSYAAFGKCTSIDLSNADTSKATKMDGCRNLESGSRFSRRARLR